MVAEHKLLHAPYAIKVVVLLAQYIWYIGSKIYDYRHKNIEYAAP